MAAKNRRRTETLPDPLPALRYSIAEAARMVRMSRAQIYKRVDEGVLRPQKDGARTYFTHNELERYVASCEERSARASSASTSGLPETQRHRPSL